jgi:transposase
VLGMQEWAEVRAMREVRGRWIKEIAQRTGRARNTIRAALRSPEPPGYGPRPKRASKLDRFVPAICELLEDEQAEEYVPRVARRPLPERFQ